MAPTPFNKCVKNGGKIVTKQLKNNKYMHICYDKDGKAYPGEIKTKKKKTTSGWFNKSKKKRVGFEKEKAQVVDLLKLKRYFDEKYRS
ncbi:hypothetical protein KAW18_00125 [candidate division WOR-3 bacterium]|jgi:hypothetical protein|nr:hypothetical protein [Candidatus Parcubacteria bacterium]MCK4525746.1 hypothetical protein [candidate division WOR-3 bacterium]